MLLLLQTTPEQWYEQCRQAGFLLSHDSPALAKNYGLVPGTEELDPPPWFDMEGNEIAYIGACPEIRSQSSVVPPSSPTGLISIDLAD